MKNKLSLFAVPYVGWMSIFVVAPIIIMVVYAFTHRRRGLHAGELRPHGYLYRGVHPLVPAGHHRHADLLC